MQGEAGPGPFSVSYCPKGSDLRDPKLLAVLRFAQDTAVSTSPCDVPVGLRQLGGEHVVEVWRSHLPTERGHAAGFGYARNVAVLFGHLRFDEREYASLEVAVFDAYRRTLAFLSTEGYPHLLRMWNFLPEINAGGGDMERYKQFCVGRHRAFETVSNFEARLPAASAVGTEVPLGVICFLAAREPGLQIENPRQVRALRYPRRYGPKSPTFSRAVLKRWDSGTHLYISGTASIVGHATRHKDDPLAQLSEATRNIQTLLEHVASGGAQRPSSLLSDLALLRVYVRRPTDLELIRDGMVESFGPGVPAVYCKADLCRRDLLLEIDAFGSYAEA